MAAYDYSAEDPAGYPADNSGSDLLSNLLKNATTLGVAAINRKAPAKAPAPATSNNKLLLIGGAVLAVVLLLFVVMKK